MSVEILPTDAQMYEKLHSTRLTTDERPWRLLKVVESLKCCFYYACICRPCWEWSRGNFTKMFGSTAAGN